MKNYKLDIYTNPINKTCGFIYMGYQGNRLIVGYTNNSIADRYKKTAPWGNWFGIDLQSFKGWDNLNSLLNKATQKARLKTSKGKPLEFEFKGELVKMGYQSNITKNFNKIAEEFLIYICNRKFGKPLGRKEEYYTILDSIIPTDTKDNVINNILENHFVPVWELMLEDVKKYNQAEHLIKLYEELRPWEDTA